MRRKLTADQKIIRSQRRMEERHAAAAVVDERRAWHQARAAIAEKRYQKAIARRAKAKAKAAKKDRSPKITLTPHTLGKHGTPIDSTMGTAIIGVRRITGTHAERRAAGQRGHVRKPRRRELPRAIERRAAREGATR